jgi:Family of unknown function (DUF5761)
MLSNYIDNYTANEPKRIIDPEYYNGRVNVLNDPSDPNAQFKMFEKVAVRNKATEYRDALNGWWEHSQLSELFFSKENIQIIQNGLRAGVYQMSNKQIVVAPQNLDNLKIIMRTIYLDKAKHLNDQITQQIEELNWHVLDYCVPFVYKEAVAYLNYLRDQSTLVVPLEREVRHDRDYKQLQYKPF